MAITKADILFSWDHALKLLSATVGGAPTFSRAGNAYAKQVEGVSVQLLADTPRFTPEGLALAPAVTNLFNAPIAIDSNATNWPVGGGGFTYTAKNSIYSGAIAYEHTADGSSGCSRQQLFTSGATPYAMYFDFEVLNDSTVVNIGIYDSTDSDWVCYLQYESAFGFTASKLSSAGGTNVTYGIIRLLDVGPNGGAVNRMWFTADVDNSHAMIARIYPTGASANTNSVILHGGFLAAREGFQAMVEGTQVVESMEWSRNFSIQSMVVYFSYVVGGYEGGWVTNYLWAIQGNSNPRTSVRAFPDSLYFIYINPTGGTSEIGLASFTPLPGDFVEVVYVLKTDGSTRAMYRINGAAVVSGSSTAAGGAGLTDEWDSDKMTINQTATQGAYHENFYRNLKVVKGAAPNSDLDNVALMDEMAGLYVSPDGARVSNAI